MSGKEMKEALAEYMNGHRMIATADYFIQTTELVLMFMRDRCNNFLHDRGSIDYVLNILDEEFDESEDDTDIGEEA